VASQGGRSKLLLDCRRLQLRLRVSRLTNIPPRLKPRIAPKNAAVNVVPIGEPAWPREKRKAVYAPESVQNTTRR
jgi:hypothetical protein